MSFVTFNYDLALDQVLFCKNLSFGYCLSARDPRPTYPLLKLHGSINWGRCQKCKDIVPYQFNQLSFRSLDGVQHVRYDLGSRIRIGKLTHCEKPVHDTPVLVPPTWGKASDQREIARVWKRAAQELSLA